MEANTILEQPAARTGSGEVDADAYRRRSYELWQRMAGRWERGREVLSGRPRGRYPSGS